MTLSFGLPHLPTLLDYVIFECSQRENMESDDLPEDLVHCPECAKPVKAKAIVIHFRRAHGRLPPGRRMLDPKSAAMLLTRYRESSHNTVLL